MNKQEIDGLISVLHYDERAFQIMTMRCNGTTLDAIARKIRRTRERVRQICKRYINHINKYFTKNESAIEKCGWDLRVYTEDAMISLNEEELNVLKWCMIDVSYFGYYMYCDDIVSDYSYILNLDAQTVGECKIGAVTRNIENEVQRKLRSKSSIHRDIKEVMSDLYKAHGLCNCNGITIGKEGLRNIKSSIALAIMYVMSKESNNTITIDEETYKKISKAYEICLSDSQYTESQKKAPAKQSIVQMLDRYEYTEKIGKRKYIFCTGEKGHVVLNQVANKYNGIDREIYRYLERRKGVLIPLSSVYEYFKKELNAIGVDNTAKTAKYIGEHIDNVQFEGQKLGLANDKGRVISLSEKIAGDSQKEHRIVHKSQYDEYSQKGIEHSDAHVYYLGNGYLISKNMLAIAGDSIVQRYIENNRSNDISEFKAYIRNNEMAQRILKSFGIENEQQVDKASQLWWESVQRYGKQ